MSDANGKEPAALEPVDAQEFMEEFHAGMGLVGELPVAQSTLAALAYASQYALHRKDCPEPIKELLVEFLQGCVRDAGFGEQTRRLLAWQAQGLREMNKPLIIVPGGR